MLTAKGRDIEIEKGLALGADAYVTKPFSTGDLVARVAELLDGPDEHQGQVRAGPGGLFLYVVAGLAVLWAAVSSSVSAGDRSVLERIREQVPLAVFLGVLFLLGLAAILALFFNRYVRPPERIARETQLIANANSTIASLRAGRPSSPGSTEAINELADRSQGMQRDVEGKIAAATRPRAGADEARGPDVGADGVLVCNVDGRILLYNDAARGVVGEAEREAGLVGLGRSIFGILDRSVIDHAIERSARVEGSLRGRPYT